MNQRLFCLSSQWSWPVRGFRGHHGGGKSWSASSERGEGENPSGRKGNQVQATVLQPLRRAVAGVPAVTAPALVLISIPTAGVAPGLPPEEMERGAGASLPSRPADGTALASELVRGTRLAHLPSGFLSLATPESEQNSGLLPPPRHAVLTASQVWRNSPEEVKALGLCAPRRHLDTCLHLRPPALLLPPPVATGPPPPPHPPPRALPAAPSSPSVQRTQGWRAGAGRRRAGPEETTGWGPSSPRAAAAMPNSVLWAVDLFGKVYTLSTAGQYWELCRDSPLEFKRVSATTQCCWGIACDNQVYVFVCASDVPIRRREEAYENQRWNPVGGFCEKFLPSDRWQWSDVSGLQHRPLDGVALPSRHWEWESDWYVDENFGGEPTEKGGWTYAIDFPATYTRDKKWNSCVRRRRWIRYRRYKSRDTWAKIPSKEDPKQLPDPFNDLSVGGWEITDEPVGRLSVWAVSLQGKVWYREDVSHPNPEGSSWSLVDTPGEAVQISCGPHDLLWVTLWEGQALVREGINRNSPKGSSWSIVEPPASENGIVHVSVGVGVVWAITKDRKVWFRRGVNSHNPCGTSWIEMVGDMMMVNVGLNDQVWGIGCEDRAVYFRQGVTQSELSGKTWKAIVASRESDRSHSGSSSSLLSAGCFFGDEVRGSGESCAPSDTDASLEADRPGPDQPVPAESVDGPRNPRDSLASGTGRTPELAVEVAGPATQTPGPEPRPGAASTPAELPWTNIDLKEPKRAPSHSAVSFPETTGLSSLGLLPLGLEEPYGADDHPLWAWVSGGGCAVEAHAVLKWFTVQSGLSPPVQTLSLSIMPAQTAAWRKQIFQQLTERTKRELEHFRHYEQAVEQSVWVKTGALQWWCDWKPHKWVDVRVALEQFTGLDGARDSILFIYYVVHEEKKYIHVFLNEVTVLVPVLNETKHSFALYTSERTRQRWPVHLAAATEQDMNDWLALLNLSCCESRRVHGRPSPQAIWSITCKGDIFVSEPSPDLEASEHMLPCDQMFWRQMGGHLRVVEANGRGVVWGIGYDHTAWVYTGGYGGGCFQGLASSTSNIYTQSDVKCVYIYENQRWNPVTGYSSRGLPTDRYMWSDASGLHECTKAGTKPPSLQWTWVSDWSVDFSVPGGTDQEGWQYASDFPASYHGYKTMKDFVRRRCWARKCKLVTSGPWLEVAPIALGDVSIIPESPSTDRSGHSIALWAVSDKGDVLCRLGVSELNPAGSSWLHVGTDQPFTSVSIGACHQVWAVARDGSAFYRGSVSPAQPAGDCWYHIPSPPKQRLKQVSVGQTSVYALDENESTTVPAQPSRAILRLRWSPAWRAESWLRPRLFSSWVGRSPSKCGDSRLCLHGQTPKWVPTLWALLSPGNLWYRQGVTPSYPQGSSWEHVSNNVCRVSVGPLDQVWIIANKVPGSHSLSRGTVCHRTGVQPRQPKGQGWDYGIGGGWDHITVRANATRALRSRSQETATGWSGEPGLPSTPSRVAGAPHEARGPVCC
ncbi:tectonin beta-propeller repeat-containing protein 1 isoform X2 [Zalophus californianus]|uniref:Tectonin beta-propeller repeat-containing protein 1 n=1 Tax=Zalophus californianus TaxID=9704 RepID=A0A6P9EY00_ZALCA|nr:tectonin beta-propeller repeat-containing protein 1 isoform X2 [Zalophus californianus]